MRIENIRKHFSREVDTVFASSTAQNPPRAAILTASHPLRLRPGRVCHRTQPHPKPLSAKGDRQPMTQRGSLTLRQYPCHWRWIRSSSPPSFWLWSKSSTSNGDQGDWLNQRRHFTTFHYAPSDQSANLSARPWTEMMLTLDNAQSTHSLPLAELARRRRSLEQRNGLRKTKLREGKTPGKDASQWTDTDCKLDNNGSQS